MSNFNPRFLSVACCFLLSLLFTFQFQTPQSVTLPIHSLVHFIIANCIAFQFVLPRASHYPSSKPKLTIPSPTRNYTSTTSTTTHHKINHNPTNHVPITITQNVDPDLECLNAQPALHAAVAHRGGHAEHADRWAGRAV